MEITFKDLLVEINPDRFSFAIASLSERVPSGFWPDVINDAQSAYFIRKCVDVGTQSRDISKDYIQGLKNIISAEGPLLSKAAWPVAAYELIEVIQDIAVKAGTTFDIDALDYAIHDYTVIANAHRGAWVYTGLTNTPNTLINLINDGNENQLKAVSYFLSSAIKGSYIMQGQRKELEVKGLESIERAILTESKRDPVLSSLANQIREKRREIVRDFSGLSCGT